tara:strand:- start:56 stop:238 length:183 start_codon:yes stop_codon:yes gene_type:complete
MTDFFEIDETEKTVKILNLDDLSIEDLKQYINELKLELKRVNLEIEKKNVVKKNAEDFFK